MRILARSWRKMVLCLAVLVCFSVLSLYAVARQSIDFAPVTFMELGWDATPEGYAAMQDVTHTQQFCVCGGYECPLGADYPAPNVEPVHIIARDWLGPRIWIVRDPIAGSRPDWGREVTADYHCIDKRANETLTLHLKEYDAPDSAGERQIAYLRLTIK